MVRGVFVILALLALSPSCFGATAPGTGNQAARYFQSLATGAPHEAAARPLDPAAQPLAKQLAQRYGVTVLGARREELAGKPVYRMVVMQPGGNFDDAFAVHTLAIDVATGALVPQFRNETSGYLLSSPPDRTPRDNGVATTIRRESFAQRRREAR